jgi:2-keto-4-pentenoate hydratase/2-oxohepta-3-ene-1,7-dioic acid hydratase in catechol pathway
MRYVQYKFGERIRPGLFHEGRVIDLNDLLTTLEHPQREFISLRSFIEAGESTWSVIPKDIKKDFVSTLPGFEIGTGKGDVTLEAPLRDAHKLILLAGNYREHIREVGFKVPQKSEAVTPQFFMKPPSTTVIGPGQSIILPRIGIWLDWEVELGVIIGKHGKYIPESDALEHVFGYTIINDISERAFNSKVRNRTMREKDPFMDWLHGKWFDTFAPMGPAIVTKDEVPNPHNLHITLKRNGKVEQNANTSQMLHSVPYLIHKLSQIMTIEPGDILATGTPSGVGYSKGLCLADGDILECYVELIGLLRNPVACEQ